MARVVAPLRERRAMQTQREQQIVYALKSRKRMLASAKRDNRQKKKSVAELLAMLDLRGIEARTLRPANTYVSRSHNLRKQLVGLIDHLFVDFSVPAFMY